jgi:cytochrome c-type biogenesis protein CcmF
MIGGLFVKLAFVSCLVTVLAYARHHLAGTARSLVVGRAAYFVTIVSVLGSAATLLYLILNHQFQYTYVWSYSSRDLPTPLLVSTFYAGQEGSFMLWTFYTSVIGIFLLRHSARHGYEAQVMSVFASIELALLLMLLVKNPFLYVWESYPGEVAAGYLPPDGRGLNPLLQNYWMVIHPQVLFSGFASMSVPYAYAVAAMLKRDYDSWFKAATPWLVFGTFILGTGIMMGGLWAYETLGWGGYWGWDPVENSSLVPWLVGVAAIHTTLSQRKRGAFVRTNLVLGLLGFILVVYSTFLTRSGVLGDTSVHSFVDPGMWAYWLLVGMMIVAVTVPVILFVRRWKEFPRRPVRHHYFSREFALFLGAATLVIIAILVIIGTSSPLITDLLYGKKSAVDISYYVRTIMPLGVVIGLLTGVGQLLWWTRSDRRAVLRSLIVPAAAAFLIGVLALALGVTEPLVLLIIAGAIFGLVANIQVGWRIVWSSPKMAGGAIAHIGIAVMLLGFVFSTRYGTETTVTLPQGKMVDALGFHLTFEGYHEYAKDRYAFHVRVERENSSFLLQPVMYYSAYNNGVMRHPDIANLIFRDFYLAPVSLDQQPAEQQPALQKGNGTTGAATQDVLVVQASLKPLINLVWSGVIILLVGFLVTIIRRVPEGALMIEQSDDQGDGELMPIPYPKTSSPPSQPVSSKSPTPAPSASR